MSRRPRAAEGGLIDHALNRSHARLAIFQDDGDFAAFEGVLAEAGAKHGVRLRADCVMPNQFHLVVWPRGDGDLSRFMRWLAMTHTQRWHADRRSAGSGHLYQGRFKSFPVQDDGQFDTVCRYVERNAPRAGLVARSEQWLWDKPSAAGSRSETSPGRRGPRPGWGASRPLRPWSRPRQNRENGS